MGTSEHPGDRKLPVMVNLALSSALSLTTVSLANLYLWQKEFCNRFVHYSTKTVAALDGVHPVVVATVPASLKRTRNIEFALRSAEEWRSLRGFIAADISEIAGAMGILDQADAAIRNIERQSEPIYGPVQDTVRSTRVSASA